MNQRAMLLWCNILISFSRGYCYLNRTVSNGTLENINVPFQKLDDFKTISEKGIDRENIVFERDLNLTCDKLRRLDISLTNLLENLPGGWGEELIKQILVYNTACLDLLYLCSMEKLTTLLAVEDITEPGGPKFFDVPIEIDVIRKRFKWGNDKIDEFNSALKKTYDHWSEIYEANNNFPTIL